MHTEDSGEDATGPYSIAFHRTDAANDCPVLSAGSFAANGAKATLTTGSGAFSQCLSIPADEHTNVEVFQLAATSGGVPAQFSVLDSTGKKVCDRTATTNGWTLCPLTPGVAHTVLFTGRDQAATYTLTRRDVTSTAPSAGCVQTAAAKVGGPSVLGTYGDPGSLNCHQVTTDATTDVIHLDVRDALGTANIVVLGGDGTAECSFRNRSCAATGSTTHQVLVQTPATLKAAPEYHLDALRIATADGPSPECTKVPSVSYGYGPVTGTLDESHTAVCAVLPTAGLDRFNAEITDTTGATATAVPALYKQCLEQRLHDVILRQSVRGGRFVLGGQPEPLRARPAGEGIQNRLQRQAGLHLRALRPGQGDSHRGQPGHRGRRRQGHTHGDRNRAACERHRTADPERQDPHRHDAVGFRGQPDTDRDPRSVRRGRRRLERQRDHHLLRVLARHIHRDHRPRIADHRRPQGHPHGQDGHQGHGGARELVSYNSGFTRRSGAGHMRSNTPDVTSLHHQHSQFMEPIRDFVSSARALPASLAPAHLTKVLMRAGRLDAAFRRALLAERLGRERREGTGGPVRKASGPAYDARRRRCGRRLGSYC
ncbi:hypothetical protein ACRJ4B_28515 [Streptomyces sp. GTA36]